MVRSKHVDEFNHDQWFEEYDLDVQNESDPIRTGYEDVLNWVIEKAAVKQDDEVLDLGSGTGNLCMRIKQCQHLICVDVSTKMSEVAKPKLAHLGEVEFQYKDLLEFFHANSAQFDVIISTYAIHHLEEDEKQTLFQYLWKALKPGGRAVLGDLMLENQTAELAMIQTYKELKKFSVSEAIEEEWFWYVDSAVSGMEALGFEVTGKRFSDLSWAIAAVKPSG
jgi:putative AdoMet-dependent methyltransferase